jgi:hypothetical protein
MKDFAGRYAWKLIEARVACWNDNLQNSSHMKDEIASLLGRGKDYPNVNNLAQPYGIFPTYLKS